VQIGPRTHTIRVMFKPLAGGSAAQYLALVARDRPDVRDRTGFSGRSAFGGLFALTPQPPKGTTP
jgi:hypothetical protein